MNSVFLVEDHDEVLKIWRKENIKGLGLVHLDAHMDFGFHSAKPLEKVIKTAKSLKGLKSRLEYSLSFLHYEKDFDKQTNIGNYIGPAMEGGIVNDFYWVVPGSIKEFRESIKIIKGILKKLSRQDSLNFSRKSYVVSRKSENGIISTELFGRKFIICILEKLPIIKQPVLLDIDTDFLVFDSILAADNTKDIGKRKPWILPKDLIEILKQKIKGPLVTTIAYSVNGGYTPIKYKHLGDEIAYRYAPKAYKKNFENNLRAAHYFNLFVSTNKREFYRKAVRLNPTYRAQDNNYGPLYLSLRKFSSARKEFLKILTADPNNPDSILGLGILALEKRDFNNAKKYFLRIMNKNYGGKIHSQALFGLARAEFSLKNFKRAKKILLRYKVIEPLMPYTYYLLGYIYEKERFFTKSLAYYKDTIRLGFAGMEPIFRLLKIHCHFKEKNDIIAFIQQKFRELKRQFKKIRASALKQNKRIKELCNLEKKLEKIRARLAVCGYNH